MSLLLHELRVRRGAMVGWALGLGLFLSLYTTIYRFLPAEVREMDVRALAFLNSLGIETFATFEGFILGTAFNFAPLLVGLFGVIIGVGALAGEEDEGMLELLAALPVSRVRLLLAKAAALFIAALVVMAVAGAIQAIVFTLWQIDTPVTALDLFQVAVSHWLIAFVFITFSFFIGAYLPGRGAALATATTALFVSFFGDNLAGMAPVLEPLQPFLPHAYFENVVQMLTGEVAWRDVTILLALGVGFLLAAVLSFRRRNLTVGAWPWQRPRVAP